MSLVFIGIQTTLAEPVDVVDGSIFVVNNVETPEHGFEISVIGLDGTPNACLADSDVGSFFPLVAGTVAADIDIQGSGAVVTTVSDLGVTDVVIVDTTSCLVPVDDVVDVAECISTVDLDEGVLIIPCVQVGGDVVTVHMEQRGNSSNWEVSFLGANINFDNHDDDDDSEDDDEGL